MRNALGYTLDDDTQKVLLGYNTMYKLFSQSKNSTNKLNKAEKKIYKIHANISKQIGKAKTLVEIKTENRILQKIF